jgi:alkanesulfonate monooxygenase SsuD/methylene tetrahydromethanopterin reductase-like flavin-dependent oxidoreductase (luciferase family)
MIDWARRAEARGFSTLGTIGRIAFPSYDELAVLSAAAAVTERIRLMTDILLGPIYNPVLLARDAASVDQLSRGRFVLGAGVGLRKDDFDTVGAEWSNRGRRWDAALDLMHSIWRGEPPPGSDQPVGPRPANGQNVAMMFGGNSDRSIARVAKWGIGWTMSSGQPVEVVPDSIARIRSAWAEAGREGDPHFTVLTYFALGPNAEVGARNLGDYYGFLGPYVERIIAAAHKTPESVHEFASRHEAAGTKEVIFFPAIPEVDQVDLLAEAAGLG